jgi:hypothetical protein
MKEENRSPLDIVSDCSRTQAIRSTELSGANRHATGRTLPSYVSRVFNEFRGRMEYLRTTALRRREFGLGFL